MCERTLTYMHVQTCDVMYVNLGLGTFVCVNTHNILYKHLAQPSPMNCESTGKEQDDWVRERVIASEKVKKIQQLALFALQWFYTLNKNSCFQTHQEHSAIRDGLIDLPWTQWSE